MQLVALDKGEVLRLLEAATRHIRAAKRRNLTVKEVEAAAAVLETDPAPGRIRLRNFNRVHGRPPQSFEELRGQRR